MAVAVFPFAARTVKNSHLERAQVCRVAFYQHFSVRDFEDVEMQALDRRLVPDDQSRPNGLLQQFAETVSWLDVVGLTSFLDVLTAQTSVQTAQRSLSQSKAKVLTCLVSLNKALGGGWGAPA